MYSEQDEDRLRGLVPAVVARLPKILREVRDQLCDRHPEYAHFLDEESDTVVAAASGFVGRLLGLTDAGPEPGSNGIATGMAAEVETTLFQEIGRAHHREGQDIAGLLAAYRTGAAVAWRHVADEALAAGVSSEVFAGLAGAVFAAVDHLSSTTLRGYVQEQSDAAQARGQLRNELAELLLSDRSGTAAVQAAAARAGWVLPREAAVVLVNPDHEVGRALLARLPEVCLRLRRPEALIAIVPDPGGPGRRSRLATSLRGASAVIGVTVPPGQLPASLAMAELAARLLQDGVVQDDPLFVEEHLDAAIVHGDDRLLTALRRRHLAPLAGLTGPSHDRLEETLTSWLMNMGNQKAMARDLHVHPQTVRYRMGRLRELFGPDLDDPSTRAALLLGLAWGPPASPDLDRDLPATESASTGPAGPGSAPTHPGSGGKRPPLG